MLHIGRGCGRRRGHGRRRRNRRRRRAERGAGRRRRQGDHIVAKKRREGLLSDLAVNLFQLMRPLKRAHGLLRLQTEFAVHVPVQIAQIVKPLLHQPHVVALQPAHQNALAEVRRVHFLRRHDRRRPCGFGRRRLGLRRKRQRQQQGRAQSGEVSIVHVSSSV